MPRRGTFALATFALVAFAGTAGAQRASLAVGVANPVGDFASTAGSGLDIAFQVRTEPMIGPLALRLELGYDFFSGRNGNPGSVFSGQGISVLGDVGSIFYWAVGPGHYDSTIKTEILGHGVTEQGNYFGVQAAVGVNIPVFSWDGFIEVGGTKLFSPNPTISYVPVRFGMRL